MFYILGGDGKEYGPVSIAKVQEWIAGGRANLQTQARRAEETGWRPLGDFAEFNSAATAAVPPPVDPASAVATVPVLVSAPAPAPAPAAAPLGGTPSEIAATLLARSKGLDIGRCISRSFDLWKSNLLPLVGVTTLIMFIQFVLGFIPFVSLVNSFFLAGVFTGGLYYYYLGKMRKQPREIGDAFAGFNKALGPLGLTNLLMSVLMIAIMLPFFFPLFGAIFKFVLANQGATTPPTFPALSAGLLGLTLVGIIPVLYFGVAWVLAYALVIDKGLGPWTALEVSRRVVTRYWFHMFVLLLVGAFFCIVGTLVVFIGVLFAVPLAIGFILYAYEDLCGEPS